jgi:hypothetical protein
MRKIKFKDVTLVPTYDQHLKIEAGRIVIIWSNTYKIFKSDSTARIYQKARVFAFAYRIVQTIGDDFELLPVHYSDIYKKYVSDACRMAYCSK